MGEARELLQKLADVCRWRAGRIEDDKASSMALLEMANVFSVVSNILATQPDPVPELPEYVTLNGLHGFFEIFLDDAGSFHTIAMDLHPDDLDRISEAARILAARERARRAGL